MRHQAAVSGVPVESAREVLVVGGGLAGTAAAITMARAGRAVTLLERDATAKHKVCGEFLSGEALMLLDSLGVSARELGGAPMRVVRLCSGDKIAESSLPFPAMSLTRLRLDAAMLRAATEAGVEVRCGANVLSLAQADGMWQAELSDGTRCAAAAAVLATGKHDLRGRPRPHGIQGDLVAMKMYWRLQPAANATLEDAVELTLFPGGYSGMQSVEEGMHNFSGLIHRRALAKLGGWEGFLQHVCEHSPHLRQRLAGAEPLLPKALAISHIPYGFLRAEALGERLWAVGDQAAVIPSFTGDGMSIALYSGVRAGQSILGGESAADFQQGLRRELRWQVAKATALSLAIVREPTKRLLMGAVRAWPGLLSGAATATRLPAVNRQPARGLH